MGDVKTDIAKLQKDVLEMWITNAESSVESSRIEKIEEAQKTTALKHQSSRTRLKCYQEK